MDYKKALSFYNQHIISQKMEELDLQTLNSAFNNYAKVNLNLSQFEKMLDDITTAKTLADQLQKDIDYVVTEKNGILLMDKLNRRVMDQRLASGVHEFLEEILRSKQILGPKTHNQPDSTSVKALLERYKTNLGGFSGTVSGNGGPELIERVSGAVPDSADGDEIKGPGF